MNIFDLGIGKVYFCIKTGYNYIKFKYGVTCIYRNEIFCFLSTQYLNGGSLS